MPSKQLMGVWIFLDFCLLLSGLIALIFSIVWREPGDLIRTLVINNSDLEGEFRVVPTALYRGLSPVHVFFLQVVS